VNNLSLDISDFYLESGDLTVIIGQESAFVQYAKAINSLQTAMIAYIIGRANLHDWLSKVKLDLWSIFI